MKGTAIVTAGKLLGAGDDATADYLSKKKSGTILNINIVEPRNGQFHRKVMSMFGMIHDQLPEPEPVEIKGRMVTPAHTFDSTRKYLTIMAGYYEIIGLPNGKYKYEAKSLSYDKMDQQEFEKFFSDVVNAGLKLMPESWSAQDLDSFANNLLGYVA